MTTDPLIKILAEAINRLTDQEKETKVELHAIHELLLTVSTQLNDIKEILSDQKITSIQTRVPDPLLYVTLPKSVRVTLDELKSLYSEKKRHIGIKELDGSVKLATYLL